MHVPIEIAEQARERAKALGADCCVAVGGGFYNGPGQSHRPGLNAADSVDPTTYAGSEMTPIWGITENGLKKTGRDPRVLPKTVLYDPTLTVSMRRCSRLTSGMKLDRALRGGAVFQRREARIVFDDCRRRHSPRWR